MAEAQYEKGKAPIIQGFVPGLPEIGKIKIGKKGEWRKSSKGREYQPPQKLDHFIITTMDRDEKTGNFVEDTELMESLPKDDSDKLTELPIKFLYNDTVLNFQSRFTCYKGKTLWCSGDGVGAYRLDETTGEREFRDCPCEHSSPDYEGKQICKPYGILSCIIDGVKKIGGVWKFRTTSYHNCRNIPSSMQFVKAITKGQLMGIPLKLVLQPQLTQLKNGTQQKLYLVRVIYTEGDYDQLAEA